MAKRGPKIREGVYEPAKSLAISGEQFRRIRKILGLPPWARFPRCQAKSASFVKRCEEMGDFSHSKLTHICDKCRCQHTAGYRTKGDFYGLGEETGHYGCGYCAMHEKGRRRQFAKEFAVEHMRLLQGVGVAQSTSQEFQLAVQEEARAAVARQELRAAVDYVKETINAFRKACEPEDATQADAIAKQLETFNNLIAANGGLEPKELQAVLELTNMAIVMRSGLTEKGKNGPIAMSDDTRFDNIRKFASVIASLAMDDFKVSEKGYVPIDEIAIRIPRMLNLVQRFVAKKEDWEKFVAEFRVIWGGLG